MTIKITKEDILLRFNVWKGSTKDFCAEMGVPSSTFYKWKAEAGKSINITKSPVETSYPPKPSKAAIKFPASFDVVFNEILFLDKRITDLRRTIYVIAFLLVAILYKIW